MESANGAPVAAYREQTAEIALGPKEALENGDICTLTRRVPVDRVVVRRPAAPRHAETPQGARAAREAG